jgi:hypothetical protein
MEADLEEAGLEDAGLQEAGFAGNPMETQRHFPPKAQDG